MQQFRHPAFVTATALTINKPSTKTRRPTRIATQFGWNFCAPAHKIIEGLVYQAIKKLHESATKLSLVPEN